MGSSDEFVGPEYHFQLFLPQLTAKDSASANAFVRGGSSIKLSGFQSTEVVARQYDAQTEKV
ncbi:MAG: hypothetical protein ACRD2S_09095 [Terriglobales bacterium]